jgi:tetratricopeptide (TPR) repeat protein
LDIGTNIHYDALLERLLSFSKEEIISALTGSIEKLKDNNGGNTLVRLMGDLGWMEFIQPLILSTNDTNGDYLCEAAMFALSNIGESARDALIAQWDELDSCQQIYGATVLESVGGDAVVDFALSRFDELVREDFERWCNLAQAVPDVRLLEKLRPEVRRKQALIDETYYRLCRLLDAEGKELPEVHQRILQERQRQQNAMKNFHRGDFVSDRKTLHLSLRCTACGEVNGYDVKAVVIDDKGGNPLVADEFPCLSCGEFVEFEFEPIARMALLAETIRVQAAHAAGDRKVNALISVGKVRASDETVLPLTTAFADWREKIHNNPNDWLSLFRLGNIQGHINRPKASLDSFRKAHAINPQSMETIVNLAAKLDEFGKKKEAFELLTRSLKDSANWQTISGHPAEKGWEVAQLYNQLRRELGRDDLPALHPSFMGSVPKVGRNDPCPCGSGKKYKKCCMK